MQVKTATSSKSVLLYPFSAKSINVPKNNNNVVFQKFTIEELKYWLKFATDIEKDFYRVRTEDNKRINSFVEHSHRIFQGKLGEYAILNYLTLNGVLSDQEYKASIEKIKENYANKDFINIDYSDISLPNGWIIESKTSAVMREDGVVRNNNIVGNMHDFTPDDIYNDIIKMKLNIVCEKDHLDKILRIKQAKNITIDENKFYIVQLFLPASYGYIIKYLFKCLINAYYKKTNKVEILEHIDNCKYKNLVEHYLLKYFSMINNNSTMNEKQNIVDKLVKDFIISIETCNNNKDFIELTNNMLSDPKTDIYKIYDLFIKGVLYFYTKCPNFNVIIFTEGIKLVDTVNKQPNYRINGPHKVSLYLPIGAKDNKKIFEILEDFKKVN